jgi:hypothetical protein
MSAEMPYRKKREFEQTGRFFRSGSVPIEEFPQLKSEHVSAELVERSLFPVGKGAVERTLAYFAEDSDVRIAAAWEAVIKGDGRNYLGPALRHRVSFMDVQEWRNDFIAGAVLTQRVLQEQAQERGQQVPPLAYEEYVHYERECEEVLNALAKELSGIGLTPNDVILNRITQQEPQLMSGLMDQTVYSPVSGLDFCWGVQQVYLPLKRSLEVRRLKETLGE